MQEVEKIAIGGVYFLAEPIAAKKIKSLPEKTIQKEGLSDYFLLKVDEWKPFINIDDIETAEKEGLFISNEESLSQLPEKPDAVLDVKKNKILTRSKNDSYLGGVLGGVGRYFGIDPIVLRLVFILSIYSFLNSYYFILFLANLYGVFRVILPISQESDETTPRFFRMYEKSILAGVCISLAVKMGVRVSLIRFLFVIGAAIFGFGLVIYLSLWLLSPYQDEERLKKSPLSVKFFGKNGFWKNAPLLSFRSYINTIFYAFRVYIGFGIWAVNLILAIGVVVCVFVLLFPQHTNIDKIGEIMISQFNRTFFAVEIISAGVFCVMLLLYGAYLGYGLVFGFAKRFYGYHAIAVIIFIFSSLGFSHGAIKAFLFVKNRTVIRKSTAFVTPEFLKINLKPLDDPGAFPVEFELVKSKDEYLHIVREFTTHGLSRQEAVLKGHNQSYGFEMRQNELILDDGFMMEEKTKFGMIASKVKIAIPCNRRFKLSNAMVKELENQNIDTEIEFAIPEFSSTWLYECQGRLLRVK